MANWENLCVNPKPITDVGNEPAARNWAAINQNGLMLVSHGLKVPSDTGGQPPRPWAGGITDAPGTWAQQRFGFRGATIPNYDADVCQSMMVYDWNPSGIKGYVFDSYGNLWPFGEDTPMAGTGFLGAPFGLLPFNPVLSAGGTQVFIARTVYNDFQMHSANGLPFGLGGWPDGFGWFISQEGTIVNWGGPVRNLPSPPMPPLAPPGSIGVGLNIVADFEVNPNNNGEYFVLYKNGWVTWSPEAGNPAIRPIVSSQPAINHYELAGSAYQGTFRWMHVNWEEGWIVSMTTRGETWGYNMSSNSSGGPVGTIPALPSPWPWYDGSGLAWRDGAIIPDRNPQRFYLLHTTGGVYAPVITGTIQPITLSFGAGTGTTPTETTRPTLTWTFNEIGVDGHTSVGSQASYNVRVYPQAITAATGFVVGQNAGAIWISDRPQVVTAPGTGSDKINRDLTNNDTYVAYARVKDTAIIQGAWSGPLTFALSIAPPATPATPSAVVTGGGVSYPRLNTVDITTNPLSGPELAAGVKRQFQVSAEGGAWIDVFQASATTLATVRDPYPPTNVLLRYRVRSFKNVPGQVSSPWAYTPLPAMVVPPAAGQPQGWRLIDPWSPDLNNPLICVLDVEEWSMERTEPRGEFQPLSSDAMIVTSAGVKGTIHTLTVRVLDSTEYRALWEILSLGHSLILQNVFGRQWWVRPTPGTWTILRAAPVAGEVTEIRDAHKISLRLVETMATPAP